MNWMALSFDARKLSAAEVDSREEEREEKSSFQD